VPSTVATPLAPAAISTRWALRSAGFGIVTSRTPFSNRASIALASVSRGSVSEREKLPNARSIR
jgi:hypothetical protein